MNDFEDISFQPFDEEQEKAFREAIENCCPHMVSNQANCVLCSHPTAYIWPCIRCNPNGGTWHENSKCLSCGEEIK